MLRSRSWLNITFMFAITLSVIWVAHLHPKPVTPANAHTINAFMHGANYYQYDDNGQLSTHLTAPYVRHYAISNNSDFIKPNMLVFTAARIPWYIHADSGKSLHGEKVVHLYDHVKLYQPPTPSSPTTTITTQRLTIYPQSALAKTQAPVTIKRPHSIVKGHGMQANLRTGLFKSLAHTRGVYVIQ